MMAAAHEPLTVALLARHFGWMGRQKWRFHEGVGTLFRVQGEDGIIVPFHRSVMDWLTNNAPSNYYVDAKDGTKALADWGWQDYREQGPEKMPPYFLWHLPAHFAETGHVEKLIMLLEDLDFLEAKVVAGLAFQLPLDFTEALKAVPHDHDQRRILTLLDEAVRRDIYFIARHAEDYPQALFQCLWNSGWWYDCPEAAAHYKEPEGGWSEPPPWDCPRRSAGLSLSGKEQAQTGLSLSDKEQAQTGLSLSDKERKQTGLSPNISPRAAAPKLYTLLEDWRERRAGRGPDFAWLGSLRPLQLHLGTAQQAILQGYTGRGRVNSVCFSPDGACIASSSWDNTVRVWDASTGTCLRTLEGHTDPVWSVSFSPDGARIASSSWDNTVRVWDASTGTCLRTLEGHTDPVWSVSFSPDGARIASGSLDKTVRVWDAATGECLRTLEGHMDWVLSVSFSRDGTRIASGLLYHTVRVWDAATGECLEIIQGTGNTASIAAGSAARPFRALARKGATVIEEAASGAPVAWFPAEIKLITTDATGQVWAGSSGNYLALIRLEKG